MSSIGWIGAKVKGFFWGWHGPICGGCRRPPPTGGTCGGIAVASAWMCQRKFADRGGGRLGSRQLAPSGFWLHFSIGIRILINLDSASYFWRQIWNGD